MSKRTLGVTLLTLSVLNLVWGMVATSEADMMVLGLIRVAFVFFIVMSSVKLITNE